MQLPVFIFDTLTSTLGKERKYVAGNKKFCQPFWSYERQFIGME